MLWFTKETKENQILLKILGKELYEKFDKYNRHLTSEYTIVILPLKVTRIVFCTGLIDQRRYQCICAKINTFHH